MSQSNGAIPIAKARRKKLAVHVDDQCTDVANGVKFADWFAGSLRYVPDRGIWIDWDDHRWKQATEGDRLQSAKFLVEALLVQAAQEPDEDRRRRAVAWALKSHSLERMRAAIAMAASEPIIATKFSELDQHPELLTVANGTVDLRTGELRTSNRKDFLTKLTPIELDQAATCPRWHRFLTEVFKGDVELIRFLQRAVGYSLTGHTREQCFFILHGSGSNGKGRFIRTLMKLAGDAAETISFATIAGKDSERGGNTPELAELVGARLVTTGEPDEGVRLSEGLIKALTGEDLIRACKKYEAPFTFPPQFKLWLHCNHRPEVRGTDDGIWRRPKLIPFEVKFEGAAKDDQLDAKLDAELPGILNWAIEGAKEWFANGLGSCEAVDIATQSYREESDVIGPFIRAHITTDKGAFTSSKHLYEVYTRWCEANAVEPWKSQTLTKRLTARGFKTGLNSSRTKRGFIGMQVTE